MLDLIFYPQTGQIPVYVEVSESLYEWLARSKFAKVGQSHLRSISLDGEELQLSVVDLEQDIRQGLAQFLRDQIIEESDQVLGKLNELESKSEVQDMTYRLRKFQELRKCVENPAYKYFQRV